MKQDCSRGRESIFEKKISMFNETSSLLAQTSSSRLNLGSFDRGNLAAFLVNDESSSTKPESKNFVNPSHTRFDLQESTIDKGAINQTKMHFKKTPFNKIGSEEKTSRHLTPNSNNNESAITRNHQISAEKPSLNVSRSLNF